MKNISVTGNKVKEKLSKIMSAASICALVNASQAYAFGTKTVTVKDEVNVNTAIGGLFGTFLTIIFYGGVGAIIIGAAIALFAAKDDNADRVSLGIKTAVVGIALVALQTILKTMGILG